MEGGPLTPNHLLLGRASIYIPEGNYDGSMNLTRRMKYINEIVQQFWNKWYVNVFPSLVPQYRWHKKYRNIKVGDVVLIMDEHAIRATYKMGQVAGVKQGRDGHVRRVNVKYKCVPTDSNLVTSIAGFKYTERPIHKLVVIVPVEEIGDEIVRVDLSENVNPCKIKSNKRVSFVID